MICVAWIIAYGLVHKTKCGDGKEREVCPVSFFKVDTLPVFFGIVTFALEGVATVIPIERSMADPGQFHNMLYVTMTALCVLFCIFGAVGYGVYGSNTASVIAVNVEGVSGAIVKILICCVLAFSYPMQFVSG